VDLRQGRAAQGMAEKRQRASMGGQALPSVIFFSNKLFSPGSFTQG
jgi:hypothetical protein